MSATSNSTSTARKFPSLQNAKFQPKTVNKEYKSGAVFSGTVQDNKRYGTGTFMWPNGATYEGEFVENERHGQGVQSWPDGSEYKGNFASDLRHGKGTHKWANGEHYEGNFFRDRRHGRGTYTWGDGSTYCGMFYLDKREGYGTFKSANGVLFQGLYKEDEREGPGIATYTDGTQDVGLWHREKLVKLCSRIDGSFHLADHPELQMYPDQTHAYITLNKLHHRASDVIDTVVSAARDEVERYSAGLGLERLRREATNLFTLSEDTKELALQLDAFEQEFFKEAISEHCDTLQTDAPVPAKEDVNQNDVTSVKDDAVSVVSAGDKQSGNNSRKSSVVTFKSEVIDDQGTVSDVTSDVEGVAETRSEVPAPGTASTHGGDAEPRSLRPSLSVIMGADSGDAPPSVHVWNRTPALVTMQKHVLRHKCFQHTAGFDVEAVINGVRGARPCGALETASRRLLKASGQGDLEEVSQLLNSRSVSADVADCDGNTALIAAATNWSEDVVNCLLDNAADINKLNDEDGFKYNIAESYLEKPREQEEDSAAESGQSVGTVTPQTDRRVSVTPASLRGKSAQTEKSGPRLGTLTVRRATRTDAARYLSAPRPHADQLELESMNTDLSEFDSAVSIRDLEINVKPEHIERCATQLSTNEMLVGRVRSAKNDPNTLGTVRKLALDKSRQQIMQSTIRLLLRRGADPNAAAVPLSVLFFAIKSGDVEAVRLLLQKGAATTLTLAEKLGSLSPLHIAVAVPGEAGVEITALLLQAGADPDARASEDDSFLNRLLRENKSEEGLPSSWEDEWRKDVIDEESRRRLGGRTPLLIACARDDDYKNACRVVRLLLEHQADPNLLCNGHSALALTIMSGNDLAVDELLKYGADPNLTLTHGAGSVLCIAASTEYEFRRSPDARVELVDKLVKAGADILAPIPIGPKRLNGTAVDFAYYMYNLDRRIAHIPYHALSHAERETFNARRRLLAHLGDLLRECAVSREARRLRMELNSAVRSRSPSPNFVYTGAGAAVPDTGSPTSRPPPTGVSFDGPHEGRSSRQTAATSEPGTRKPLFRYCYQCGRMVGVRLTACTRCKEVYYCSKACKLKAWNARHKDECVRIGATEDKKRTATITPKIRISEVNISSSGDQLPKVTSVIIEEVPTGRSRSPSPKEKPGELSTRGTQRLRPSAANRSAGLHAADDKIKRTNTGARGRDSGFMRLGNVGLVTRSAGVHKRQLSSSGLRLVASAPASRRQGSGGVVARGPAAAWLRRVQTSGVAKILEARKKAKSGGKAVVEEKSWKDDLPDNCYIGNYSFI